MAFDPDAYLSGGTAVKEFDPDAYLAVDTELPEVVATEGGGGFLEKINEALKKPSPAWLQAPESALRELITEQLPHDIPSYLKSIGGPVVQGYEQAKAIAGGDVSGLPLVGRVPEIMAADETPAFSKERYKTALKTLMDVGALAGAVEGPRVPLRAEPLVPEPPPTQRMGPGTIAGDVQRALDRRFTMQEPPPEAPPQLAPAPPVEDMLANVPKEPPVFNPELGPQTIPEFQMPLRTESAVTPGARPLTPGAAKQLRKLKAHKAQVEAIGGKVDPDKVTAKIAEIEGVEHRVQHGEHAKPGYTAVDTPPEVSVPAAQPEFTFGEPAYHGNTQYTLHKRGNNVEVAQINANTAGGGIKFLQDLTRWADENGLTLSGDARPMRTREGVRGLPQDKLKRLYRQFGFEEYGDFDRMMRVPVEKPPEAPVQAQEGPSFASEAPGGVPVAETPVGAAEPPPPGAGMTREPIVRLETPRYESKDVASKKDRIVWQTAKTGEPITVPAWRSNESGYRSALTKYAKDKIGRESVYGDAWYGARDPDIAQDIFAGKEGGISQYDITLQNPYVIASNSKDVGLTISTEQLNAIKAAGHDGIIVKPRDFQLGIHDRGGIEVAVFKQEPPPPGAGAAFAKVTEGKPPLAPVPPDMINAVKLPSGKIVGHNVEHGDVLSRYSEQYEPGEMTSGWVLKRPTRGETDATFIGTDDVQRHSGDFDAAFKEKQPPPPGAGAPPEVPPSERGYAGMEPLPQKPSKIGQSIEAKAVEAKLTKGFPETAGYDPITIKDQAARASDLVKQNPSRAGAIIRGEEPLPPEIKGTSLITAMEEHLLRNPSAQGAYELANSRLVSLTSEAAQEMRLMSERVPDGITTKFAEIKAVREKGAELRKETKAKVKKEINGEVVKAASKRPTWEAFVREIVC